MHREMLISAKCLHDLPNSKMTALVIGTEVRIRLLMLGARYPILFIN